MGEKVLKFNAHVFELFNPLNSDDSDDNITGSVVLLKYFAKTDGDPKESKEREYALKRIIRGLGAATCSSKTVFFRTLIGYLTLPTNASLTVGEIFQIMEKELHLGKEIKNKEDSDALIGHILLCGSLIRSNKLDCGTDDDLAKCVQLLVKSSEHKMFHASLAFTFLIELLSKLSVERFQSAIWPIMAKHLKRPWERQNINTIHFLLGVYAKYPELVDAEYLESAIQTPEILSPISFKHLGRMFWGNTTMNAITHPAYDELSQFLCKSKSKQLTKFWRNEVNECLAAPTKLKEIVTVKILKDILNSGSFDTTTLLKLLTDRFIKMIVNSLKNVKQMKKGSYLVYYYDEFFEAINKHLSKTQDDDEKVEIISKFILHPGALTIEKYTPQNIVRQMIMHLGSPGIMKLTQKYKSVFIGELSKDPSDPKIQWLNVEKQHAAQMMQFLIGSKLMQNEVEWRIEQSKFMAAVSFFYISSDGTPVTAENDSGFITKDLWMNVKNIFYSSLQTKLPNLKNQKEMLLAIVQFCNEIISTKKRNEYLRVPLTKESRQSWKKMFAFVTSPKGSNKMDKKLDSIFRIMFMYMGLQLFREPEMAELAIVDLEKCMENINEKKLNTKKLKNSDDQPQWIEVVIDIFLHLLSKNTKFLKFVVNTLFTHLCPSLTLTAVNQILSVLDMNVANPLSNDDEGEASDEEDDDLHNENTNGKSSDGEESAEEASGEEEDEDGSGEEEEGESSEEDEVDDDEGTANDQLRNAISTVLGATSDTDSIDLDDMTEEEANRLDKNLSAVFQSMKKSSSKKKTKKERIIATTVMHFRIRVLDLVESYLKSTPSMEICLEIMLVLFNMIELCLDSDLKPLSDRVEKVLGKLLNLRDFENVSNVKEEDLCKLLKDLMDRKVNPTKVDVYNKLLSKSLGFIVSNLHSLEKQNDSVLNTITKYAMEFLETRNPKMNLSLLKEIFKLRWIGVWSIGVSLADHGLDPKHHSLRSFRRIQLFELLGLLYKNHAFINQNPKPIDKRNRAIVSRMTEYVDYMHDLDHAHPKEFLSLMGLLCVMGKCSKNVVALKLNEKIDWKLICEKVQQIRRKIVLTSLDSYQMFCKFIGIEVLKQCDLPEIRQNGHGSIENGIQSISTDGHQSGKKKRKVQESTVDEELNNPKANKKQKKLSKEERLRIASEGLNGISFASVSLDDVGMESDSVSE